MRRRKGFNPKRQIADLEKVNASWLTYMAGHANYGGNSEHKKNPADYRLTPPAAPRPGKTLCDALRPVLKAEAEQLLGSGISMGMVSPCRQRQWPKNVWAVAESGEVYEAQLENKSKGTYHGYPVPADDEFRDIILKEWRRRCQKNSR